MLEPLYTKKKSKIWYSKYGVGKQMVSKIYVHKDYALDVVPADILWDAKDILHKYEPDASFNCICYDPKNKIVRFDEAPRFNEDNEPYVGMMWSVDMNKIDDGERCYRVSQSMNIWHHRWLWVAEDYRGFDVQASWQRSKEWLSKLNITASGSKANWEKQLQSIGMK